MRSYYRADTVASAQKLLADAKGAARLLAGGTDLLLQIKRGVVSVGQLIDIRHIEELNCVAIGSNEIELGACVRHREIERNEYFLSRITALCEAARVIGGVQIRNMGTVGGNLVNASPAADLNPVLAALDARVIYRDRDDVCEAAVCDFITGRAKTLMSETGIVTFVRFANPGKGTGTAFLKAGRRRAMEIALVNVAVRVQLVDNRIKDARIILGAVGPKMVRSDAAENSLVDASPTAAVIAEAGRLAAAAAKPRDDVRASAEYRRHLTDILVRRALAIAIERAREDAAR